MPLNYPAVGGATIGDIAKQVWEYTTRKVTSLADPTDIIKWIGKGAALEVPADKSLYGVIYQIQFESEWSTDPVVENVASAALTSLTAGSIIPAYPGGATEVRVILLPIIKASSQAANTHHIGLKIQYRTGGVGAYTDLKDYTANPPLSLVPSDGAVDSWAQPIDVSAIVSSGVQVEFRFQVDSDNAGSINYTTSFVLLLVYRIG